VSDEVSYSSSTYRIPRHSRGMDPATRRLALIAGGLGGALLAIIGGWSVMGHRSTAVPVIQADSRPIRVKPENPGGMQIAGSNDEMSGGADTNGGKLAPPTEAPAPQALLAPPPPAPAALVAASGPVATSVPAAAKPATEKPAAPVDKRAVTSAPDRAAPVAKGALVQLAAVTSEDAAHGEWQRLEKRMPDLFGHRQPAFSKIERSGHTLWRVRTGGFSDAAQATAFCERVRAKGAGCSIADF
jgi:sporulation related protein